MADQKFTMISYFTTCVVRFRWRVYHTPWQLMTSSVAVHSFASFDLHSDFGTAIYGGGGRRQGLQAYFKALRGVLGTSNFQRLFLRRSATCQFICLTKWDTCFLVQKIKQWWNPHMAMTYGYEDICKTPFCKISERSLYMLYGDGTHE